MIETECVFPVSLLRETYQLISDRRFRVIRYRDLEKSRLGNPARYRYVDEFIRFHYGKVTPVSLVKGLLKLVCIRKPGLPLAGYIINRLTRHGPPPAVILQHDADNIPSRTLQVMQLEQEFNYVSSNYFFAEHAEGDDYQYDIELLKELERQGFEVGYHLNAYERANYDLRLAQKLVDDDLKQLRANFEISSFVPHGGISGPDGINNESYPQTGPLEGLLWAYNGNCILKEYTWSDGGVRTNRHLPSDPREFVKSLLPGTRAVMLMHPQYYGDALRDDWKALNISQLPWWRELWNL